MLNPGACGRRWIRAHRFPAVFAIRRNAQINSNTTSDVICSSPGDTFDCLSWRIMVAVEGRTDATLIKRSTRINRLTSRGGSQAGRGVLRMHAMSNASWLPMDRFETVFVHAVIGCRRRRIGGNCWIDPSLELGYWGTAGSISVRKTADHAATCSCTGTV